MFLKNEHTVFTRVLFTYPRQVGSFNKKPSNKDSLFRRASGIDSET